MRAIGQRKIAPHMFARYSFPEDFPSNAYSSFLGRKRLLREWKLESKEHPFEDQHMADHDQWGGGGTQRDEMPAGMCTGAWEQLPHIRPYSDVRGYQMRKQAANTLRAITLAKAVRLSPNAKSSLVCLNNRPRYTDTRVLNPDREHRGRT